MIGYKDMIFCKENKCRRFKKCSRALTRKVRKDAEEWWGDKNAPIIIFSERPSCFLKNEKKGK